MASHRFSLRPGIRTVRQPLETAVRRILCELERPNTAFTGEMTPPQSSKRATTCVRSPYAALSLLNSELEQEQRRLRGMAKGATVEYAERMHREVVIAMSGHHAKSDWTVLTETGALSI